MGLISILPSVEDNLKSVSLSVVCIQLMYTFYHTCEKEKSRRVCSASERTALHLSTGQCQRVVLSRTVKGDG